MTRDATTPEAAGDVKDRASIRIGAALHHKVKVLASQEGKSVKCLTEEALRTLLSQHESTKGVPAHDLD